MYIHHSLSCVSLRQYRACVVDSLGLGIVHLTSLYYVYKPSRSCFLCYPYFLHPNFYIYMYMYKSGLDVTVHGVCRVYSRNLELLQVSRGHSDVIRTIIHIPERKQV